MKFQQRLAHRLCREPAGRPFVVGTQLPLGRMTIYVHGSGIDFEKQAADRIASLHERRVVALDEREVQATILDGPFVHEKMLIFARRARDPRLADETPEAKGGGFGFRVSTLRSGSGQRAGTGRWRATLA